ncbi:ALF repeat-containing protein, partial [Streptomyces monomycini]|uniref:ALF repeat-containing protein n=1 Tax=Streptomyces monomycini TaxID=371720 RepID=UPI001AD81E4E
MSLLAGVLGTAPAVADEAVDRDNALFMRGQVVDYWTDGGTGIKAAAEQALLGTDEDIEKFFAEKDSIEFDDDYVAASRMISAGGPGLGEAAKNALKASKRDNPEPLRTFLREGWQAPLRQDNEVEASKVINFGGYGVKEAGKAALRGGPEAVSAFLDKGQYAARRQDNEVE